MELVRYLDENTLHQILKGVRQGKPLRQERLLLSLLAYQQQWIPTLATNSTTMIEFQVSLELTNLIHQQYNRLRQVHGLSPVDICQDVAQSFRSICEDYRMCNQELEAWSFLYYRYARVDLGLSPRRISGFVGQSVRNLNRREKLGITRLLQHLFIRWNSINVLSAETRPISVLSRVDRQDRQSSHMCDTTD